MCDNGKSAAGISSPRPDLLDNDQLNEAINDTFAIIYKCVPDGPEQRRIREHWWSLLAERERRLSNMKDEARL